VPNAADASDLVQEVFLRLLRIENHESIRMPEAYVFALTNHVLYQHRLRQARRPDEVYILEVLAEMQSSPENDPAAQAETLTRVEELERALGALPPRAQAALILHRRDGLTLEEIVQQRASVGPSAFSASIT
jgi:RNA polymerase sigma factor (sigma-70 family)